jgi:hypothetical protein
MSDVRSGRIDDAVSAASELIGHLLEKGDVTPDQAHILVMAAARAAVTNVEEFEVAVSAARIAAELEARGAANGDDPAK